MTIQHDGQRLADSLEELDLEGWGRDGVEGDSGEVIWEITDEQTLEDGGEVIEARIDQRKGSAQGEQLVHAHFGRTRIVKPVTQTMLWDQPPLMLKQLGSTSSVSQRCAWAVTEVWEYCSSVSYGA